MANRDYTSALAALQNDLTLLALERERIDKRASAVSAAYEALLRIHEIETNLPPKVPVIKEVEQTKFQVKAEILGVIESTDTEVSAVEIRDILISRGWEIANYKNPLSLIYTNLERLLKSGDIVISRDSGRRKWYQPRRCYDEKMAKSQEAYAALQATLAAREEARARMVELCYDILRTHPNGISARMITRELNNSIDMSCFEKPTSVVAAVLRTMTDVKAVPTGNREDGQVRNSYYLIQKPIQVTLRGER